MKEYKLKINGEIDFIIISPQVFSSLISQIPVSYTHLTLPTIA